VHAPLRSGTALMVTVEPWTKKLAFETSMLRVQTVLNRAGKIVRRGERFTSTNLPLIVDGD
jgi:hypothetical protein